MQIHLTPEEIERVANTLKGKAREIESATQAAQSSMSQIQDMHSPRLDRDKETWDKLRKSIIEAVNALTEASSELTKLAADNRAANQ